jgi:hypothetical protein
MQVVPYNQDAWSELTETPKEKYEAKTRGFDKYISILVDSLIQELIAC